MVVHTDDARHDREASQVEYGGAVARGLIFTRSYGRDHSALDVDVPIWARDGPRAIDDLNVFKDYFGGADAQVLPHLRPEAIDALGVGKLGG